MAFERGPAVVRQAKREYGCVPALLGFVLIVALPLATHVSWTVFFYAAIAVIAWFKVVLPARRGFRAARASWGRPAQAVTTVRELHARTLAQGGGAYLATGERGELVCAPPESAVLVLAGPRAGKTTCVVIPALLAHAGPAVATSTKPEVLQATLGARRRLGTAWFFDLQGQGAPTGTMPLRWSPVQGAEDWQRAQLIAEAMTGSADIDAGGAHWRERAGALLAACLHAAGRSHVGMRELVGWVLRHDPDTPLAELEADTLAHDVLLGIKHTGDRERGSIFSTAARVLRAYRSEVALQASEHPNFDPDRFVASTETVYIAASAHEQRLLAPLVVGLVTAVREAAYRRHWQLGPLRPPLLLALDECSNMAPLPDLPPTLSEGGGQSVQTMSIFQDMSQPRRIWPGDADGMMSLFGAKVIMAGVADKQTLEQLSLICGEYDRQVQTLTETDQMTIEGRRMRESWSTRRERRLPPDEIARLPKGKALVILGAEWQIVDTIPYQQHPAFAALANLAAPQAPLPGPHNGKAPDGGAVTEPQRGEGKEAQRP